jgi:hypothetical protein
MFGIVYIDAPANKMYSWRDLRFDGTVEPTDFLIAFEQ